MNDQPPPLGFDNRLLTFETVSINHTTWHYAALKAFIRTPLRTALRPGFFDAAAGRLRPGDFLTISAIDGAATLYVLSDADGRLVLAPMAWTGTIPHPLAVISTRDGG